MALDILHKNKKASFDYDISERIEAGIVLEGWEVKSISDHNVALQGSFIKARNNEIFLVGATVPSWKHGEQKTKEEENRDRKLLLNKKQIAKVVNTLDQPGFSVIPIKFYRNERKLIKLEIGIGKGKKKYDKRQSLKERDIERRVTYDRKTYNI
jgi:SsrA-binding protein